MCSETPHQWEGLEIERERLRTAVFHLKRTNRELEAILKEEGPDPELRQAIGENIVIIAKYLGEIDRLDQEIRKARGEVVNITSSQTATIPVPPDFTKALSCSRSDVTCHELDDVTAVEDLSLWM